jgi:hypothetical protein
MNDYGKAVRQALEEGHVYSIGSDAHVAIHRFQGDEVRRDVLARIMHDGARPADFVIVRQGLKG